MPTRTYTYTHHHHTYYNNTRFAHTITYYYSVSRYIIIRYKIRCPSCTTTYHVEKKKDADYNIIIMLLKCCVYTVRALHKPRLIMIYYYCKPNFGRRPRRRLKQPVIITATVMIIIIIIIDRPNVYARINTDTVTHTQKYTTTAAIKVSPRNHE